MSRSTCELCLQHSHTTSAVVASEYYKSICANCLGGDDTSSGAASFNRRRDYEDNAQDTIQPYDSVGPNKEFLRLYPAAAKKVFKPDVIEQLKRQL